MLQAVQNDDLYPLLYGDLSARTGCEQSELDEVFNYAPGSDDNDDGGYTYRRSKDTVVNNFGESLMNLYFMLDCVIVSGFCYSDADRGFAYVSPHGSYVINYFIV